MLPSAGRSCYGGDAARQMVHFPLVYVLMGPGSAYHR